MTCILLYELQHVSCTFSIERRGEWFCLSLYIVHTDIDLHLINNTSQHIYANFFCK